MGQRELSTFGFQDFEEFKSYYNDPADMFINRPGYISKFKNFSWIDYALHSGVPNKNVIIKNTNGQELEATLQISEIFLMQELNESSGIYNIELDFSSEHHITKYPHNSSQDEPTLHPHIAYEIDENIVPQEKVIAPEIPVLDEQKNEFKIEDFHDDYQDTPQTTISTEDTDDTILPNIDIHEPETSPKSVQITEDAYVPTIKLKIDLDKDFDEIDTLKDIDFNTKTMTEHNHKTKPTIEYDPIDIAQIAEDTDMDLEDIALFLNEFIKESKQTLNELETTLETLDASSIKNMMIKLKGIVSQLKIYSILHTLDAIITSIGDDDFSNKIEIFKIQIKDMEEKLF